MMAWIGIGFCLPFVLAYLLAGWTGARTQSSILGALAGMLGYCVFMTIYVGALFVRMRAQLFAFIENEVPLLISRFLGLVEQIVQFKDTL